MKQLHILHVYKDYFPILGGIENHLKSLAEAQVAAGHEVTVVVSNPAKLPAIENMNGVRLIRASRLATVASTPLSLSLPLLLAKQTPDITHLHFPYPLGEVSQLLVGRKRPFLISYHSDIVKQQAILRFYNPLLRRVLNRAAHLIIGSDRYIQTSPYLQPHAQKCSVIPYAVDTERFQPNLAPLFPPVTQLTFIFVGRHRHYKGVNVLIRAMSALRARLLVAGDGPLRHEWEQLAADLGVNKKVQFVGNINDEHLPNFYASGDLFVLPAVNRAEAFGLVLQEAMASGLPCVTSELGTGTSFLVRDGESGFVVPPNDVEALTAVLQTLISNSTLRQQMGQAGRRRALTEFQLRQTVGRITAVYHTILNDFRL